MAGGQEEKGTDDDAIREVMEEMGVDEEGVKKEMEGDEDKK